jgi:Tol biopolymer transport system component
MADAHSSPSTPASPDPREIREELERLLTDPLFARADRARRFLRFAIETALAGNAAALKETVIGVEVFDRAAGYDPGADPIVRVEARRIRAKLERYYATHGRGAAVRISIPGPGYVPVFTRLCEPRAAGVVGAPPPLPPERPARSRMPWILAAGLAAAVLAAAVLVSSSLRTPPAVLSGQRFTAYEGYETAPAFSPDARRVAFVWGGPEHGADQIYLQNRDSEAPALLKPRNASAESSPVWSPDGREMAFLRDLGERQVRIVSVPIAGGAEREYDTVLAPAAAIGHLDWSPDGRWFATSHRTGSTSAIVLIPVQGGARVEVTHPSAGSLGDDWPAFSPDGRTVAFRRSDTDGLDDVWLAPVAGGTPRRLSSDHRDIYGLTWTADGTRVIVSSKRAGSESSLWAFPVRGGEPARLTGVGINAIMPAVDRRGGSIAYTARFNDVNMWRMPLDGSGQPAKFLSSTQLDSCPQYSPDGEHLVFRSNRSGSDEIWIGGRDGAEPVRLTHVGGSATGSPRWSPDSRLVAFDSREGGVNAIHVVEARAGAAARRITADAFQAVAPGWTRDGRSVYFSSRRSGRWEIWKQPLAGGEPAQITLNGGFAPTESDDGRYLYYVKRAPQDGLWRVALAGGAESPVLESFDDRMWGYWAVTPAGLYYADFPASGTQARVQLLPAAGSPREIVAFTRRPSPWDRGLAVSPDGRFLIWVQVDLTGSDIFLLDGFR